MKTSPSVKNAIENEHVIKAVPEASILWNMNRFVSGVASNNISESDFGYDIELFPIESIIENNRPTKGINKARVGSATVSENYLEQSPGVSNGRFYACDVDDTYKYWTSPELSSGTGVIANCKPQVIYSELVKVNKIDIKTENTWASAKTFSVQVTTNPNPTDTVNSSNWVEIANQTTLGTGWKASGRIVLYYNGTGAAVTPWQPAVRTDNSDTSPKTVSIRGVRIVVTALEGGYRVTPDNSAVKTTYRPESNWSGYAEVQTTGNNSHFDLIEISAALELNISKYVISSSTNFDFSENSNILPIGTTTTNQADLVLSNLYLKNGEYVPGLFSRNNTDSPYHKFIEANALVTLDYKFYDKSGAYLDKVREFTMYTDSWTGQASDEVDISLSDYSKFFNNSEALLRAAMWEGLTAPEIVWRILDSVGFVDYHVDYNADRVTEHTIPVFYTDGEKNVWDVLDEISTATQTAIYFDSYGKLQVKTRDFAFSANDAPVATFRSKTNQSGLANIVELTLNSEFEPNYYEVSYQKTDWDKVKRNVATMQQVWEPDGEVVLRASALRKNLDLSDSWLWLPSDDVKYWPYEGLVNVQGEIIRYEGKIFVYYTGANGNTRNTKTISSQSEYSSRNSSTPVNYRHKNHFNGAVKITERGVWNSEPRRHPVEAEGYNVTQIVNGNRQTNVSGFTQNKTRSRVTLASGSRFSSRKDIRLATRGTTEDSTFFNYGTRMRFIKQAGRTGQFAGIVINNQATTEDGYYFEITPTNNISAKERASRQELMIYSRVGGKDKILKQQSVNIVENIDYEMDITFSFDSPDHYVQCWINGKNVANAVVSGGNKLSANGRFGMFIRGKTRAEFEYLYAIKREEESKLPEDFSFLDKVERGYMGGQWDREWVYRWKSYKGRVRRQSGKAGKRFNRQFFDEFGPIVHEIREFDVDFEPAPVVHSRLYLTNDWSGCALEYKASPFGAQFVIANTSRRNAVLNGEDSISFSGTDDTIAQVLSVLGRVLVVADAETVTASNAEQIRIRGKNSSDLTSPWIQSKAQAKEIANWMNARFSHGNELIDIEVFGNPLIELGDVVTIDYPERHLSGDYFVISVNNDFDQGITTNLELRRRVV